MHRKTDYPVSVLALGRRMDRTIARAWVYNTVETGPCTFSSATRTIDAIFTPGVHLPNTDLKISTHQNRTGVCGVAAGLPADFPSDFSARETGEAETLLYPRKVRGS